MALSPTTSRGGTGTTVGEPILIYRYTVSGSVKASIDTGSDTPQAGSNDWTGGDLLEVWLQARTDEAVVRSPVTITLNNDSSAIYDYQYIETLNATVSGGHTLASAGWTGFTVCGSSDAAGEASVVVIEIPNFTGTTFNKTGRGGLLLPAATATTNVVDYVALQYRSTSALTRLKVIPTTAAKNFAVGTQLLIYKRVSS